MRRTCEAGAIALALALFGTTAGQAADAADHPFLTNAIALCRPNHSRAAEVLAAAEREGWTKPPPTAFGDASKQTRWQSVGGKLLTLNVTHVQNAAGGVKTDDYICQVGSLEPFGDPTGAVRAFMGRSPTNDSGNFAEWMFTERDGRRAFLPDGSAASIAAALKTGPVEVVLVPKNGTYVMYAEIVAAP